MSVALDLLQYSFFQRALLAAFVVAVLCAVLGVFVVLRGLSMLGDGLAHISFAGFALGAVLTFFPLGIAVVAAIVGAVLIHLLRSRGIVASDTAIGILFTTGLAIGILIVSYRPDLNIDVEALLFGYVTTVTEGDLLLASGIAGVLILATALLYKELLYVTFSEEAAHVSGLPVGVVNVVFMSLTASAIVVGARVVGVLLVSALIVVPAATSLQWARSFRGALVLAVFFGALSAVAGVLAAAEWGLATGAAVALVATGLFTVSLAAKEVVKRGRRAFAAPR